MGKGGFGNVKKAYHKRFETYIAIKSFIESSEEDTEQIQLEDNLLQRVEEIAQKGTNHQHFLKYYGVFRDPNDENSLILEMESGIATLDDILSVGKVYKCDELLYVLKDLVFGFAALQEKGIANRDVKPQNVILVENEQDEGHFYYKICDFGIGCCLEENKQVISSLSISGMTKQFASPEVEDLFMDDDPDYSADYNPFLADVFSLGITALKMINYKLSKATLDLVFSRDPMIFDGYEKLLPILEKMLQEKPENRVDFKQLKQLILTTINNSVIIPAKSQEEQKYVQMKIDMNEKKKQETIKGIESIYNEHTGLYHAYFLNLNRLKQAKYHLEKRLENIQLLLQKDKELQGDLNINMDIFEEEIMCYNAFGQLNMKLGNLEKAEENLRKV